MRYAPVALFMAADWGVNNRYAVISGVCFATLRVACRKLQPGKWAAE
jgi:hypothetical protein